MTRETQGDGSSVLTNSNIKQGDCVKRTVPVTLTQIEASKYDVRLALGALILNRKTKW